MRKGRKKILTKKLNRGQKILSVISILLFIGAFGWFTFINIQEVSHYTEVGKPSVGTKVSNDLVCMVNDTYMGKRQLLVSVHNKKYYGCCEMCVEKLQKNIDNVRFAIDPQTREPVDKASAFIVLKTYKSSEVLYFKSKESYDLFKNPIAPD